MKRRRCGWPISTKYWRAIFSAASIASEPPETKYTLSMPGGRARDQVVGQRFGRLAGEEAGMRVGQLADLAPHRLDHPRMAVAEAGHRGAAARVE